MGRRGPLPKPIATKILEGTFDRQPRTPQLPQLAREIPPMPSFLDKFGRQQWDYVVPALHQLGLLTALDGMILAMYCSSVSQLYRAQAVIQQEGLTMMTRDGTTKKRPEVAIAAQAADLVRKLGNELGLSPAARARLPIKPPPEPKSAHRFFND